MRLISLDGFQFDAVLEGHVLIAANEDRPGMIESLGQVLASHNINVSNMALGRDRPGGTAVSLARFHTVVPTTYSLLVGMWPLS